jgi:hypothetical protein
MAAPVYRFLPWARRGLALALTNQDNPDDAGNHNRPLPARPSINVTMDVSGRPATAHADLYGPGEVTAIDRRTILRTDPAPGATDFEPNYLVLIDFDPPDFPWLFTPAAAGTDGILRPWCVLIVVESGPAVSLEVRADAPLPVLTIGTDARPSRELPDLAESHAWAHSQILEQPGSSADLEEDPDRNLSRLICPRRLKPETRYRACVVPAFDLGVARGLGRPQAADVVKPAWDISSASLDRDGITLPVYYFWEFSTGVEDDIESMAERLHGPEHAPEDLGRRRIYAAAGHPQLARPPLPRPARTVELRGALVPAETSATPAHGQAPELTDRVAAIVGKRDSKELPAPLYGEWPAKQHALDGGPVWMRELNTTVAHRIAAGLGTEVVRRHQEAFVQAAWEQIGQLRQANDLAQRARLSAAVLGRLVARHFAPRPPARLLQLTAPMLAATSTTPAAGGAALRTIAAELDDASLPSGATSAAYRRLASGQRQAVKRAIRRAGLSHRDGLIALTAGNAALAEPDPGPPDGVTDLRDRGKLRATASSERVPLAPIGLGGETTAAEVGKLVPLDGPAGDLPVADRRFFPQSQVGAVISQATQRAAIPQRGIPPIYRPPQAVDSTAALAVFREALRRAAQEVNRETPSAEFVATNVARLGKRLMNRLDARANVARRVSAMVTESADDGAAPFDPYEGIQAFPVINDSTYQYLDELAGGWVLPEATGLEPDTAILLRTNRAFTSAFLVGLNHEMNSELLWRGYRTDQRGTPFRHFWDRMDGRPDIEPIHRWSPSESLALAGLPAGAAEQIILLLRGKLLRRYPDLVIYATVGSATAPGTTIPDEGKPMFRGQLRPDISLVGFPMTPEQLAAQTWWFVLEQQLTAPRFGLDSTGPDPAPDWNEASWPLFDIDPGQHIQLNAEKIRTTVIENRTFGSRGDEVAISLLQRPIRVGLHKDRLLLHPGGSA